MVFNKDLSIAFHEKKKIYIYIAHRVLSRIYCLGEKSWVTKGHKLPRGSGACPPGNFLIEYALRCNLVHFETQFSDNVTVVFYFICRMVSLDREYVLHVHWARCVWMSFPIQLLIHCNDEYPSNTLDRTLIVCISSLTIQYRLSTKGKKSFRNIVTAKTQERGSITPCLGTKELTAD